MLIFLFVLIIKIIRKVQAKLILIMSDIIRKIFYFIFNLLHLIYFFKILVYNNADFNYKEVLCDKFYKIRLLKRITYAGFF